MIISFLSLQAKQLDEGKFKEKRNKNQKESKEALKSDVKSEVKSVLKRVSHKSGKEQDKVGIDGHTYWSSMKQIRKNLKSVCHAVCLQKLWLVRGRS